MKFRNTVIYKVNVLLPSSNCYLTLPLLSNAHCTLCMDMIPGCCTYHPTFDTSYTCLLCLFLPVLFLHPLYQSSSSVGFALYSRYFLNHSLNASGELKYVMLLHLASVLLPNGVRKTMKDSSFYTSCNLLRRVKHSFF